MIAFEATDTPKSLWPRAILDQIIDRVAHGENVTAICSSPDMPSKMSFYRWLAEDPLLQQRYSSAVAVQVAARVYKSK